VVAHIGPGNVFPIPLSPERMLRDGLFIEKETVLIESDLSGRGENGSKTNAISTDACETQSI